MVDTMPSSIALFSMTIFQAGLAWGGKIWACAYIQGVVT